MSEDFNDMKLAVEYALGHTNTRCHIMGKCQGNCPLSVRYCDFKSRYEAFLQGCSTKYDRLKRENRLRGNVPNQVRIFVHRNDGVWMYFNLSRRMLNNDNLFAKYVKKVAQREVPPEEIEKIRQEAIDI